MAQSSGDNKNLGGRPKTGIGTLIGVRLQPDHLSELDGWVEGQPDPKPSRPEAIRTLMRKGMAAEE